MRSLGILVSPSVRVVFLERADAVAGVAGPLHGAQGGAGAGERREVGHPVHERLAPDGVAVGDGPLAGGGVDEEVDLAVDGDAVHHVGAPLAHLAHRRGRDALRAR